MKSRWWLAEILATLLLVLLVSGCVRVDIGDKLPTLGEEMIELQQAKALGAITEDEFKRLRLAILAGYRL